MAFDLGGGFSNIGSGVQDAFGGGANFASGMLEDEMGLIPGVQAGRNAESGYEGQIQGIIDKLQANWQLPEYDQTPLTPQEYTVLNMYSPQIAAFVQQSAPQLLPAQAINQGTQAQTQALNQLGQLSQTGTDAGMQAQLENAQTSANQSLRSNRANALAALANRGLGSSGATLGADVATSLGAAEQQRQADVQAASQAAQRKAQAIESLGNLGSQIANQQQQAGEFNANTQNNYNNLIANRRQQYQQYAADTQNQANLYNQQQLQQTANANTGLQNQFNMYNQERQDRNKTNLANMNNQKWQTLAGMQGGAANQENAYKQQQAGNETSFFTNLLGIGAQGFLNGGGGGNSSNSNQSNQPGSYGPTNSKYNLGEFGTNMGSSPFGASSAAIAG